MDPDPKHCAQVIIFLIWIQTFWIFFKDKTPGGQFFINDKLKEHVSRGSVELLKKEAASYSLQPPDLKRTRLLHGVLVMKPDGTLTIQDPEVGINPSTKLEKLPSNGGNSVPFQDKT
jgi:hypothetical protein